MERRGEILPRKTTPSREGPSVNVFVLGWKPNKRISPNTHIKTVCKILNHWNRESNITVKWVVNHSFCDCYFTS